MIRRTRSDEPMFSTRQHSHKSQNHPQRRLRRYQSSSDVPLPSLPTLQVISMHAFLSHQLHYTQPPPNLTSMVVFQPIDGPQLQDLHEQYVQALPQQHERICQGLLNKLSWTNAPKLVVLYAQQMRMNKGRECVGWIVHKAQQEPHYADMYAHFAKELSQLEWEENNTVAVWLREQCWNEMAVAKLSSSWLGLLRFVGALYRADSSMIPIEDYLMWIGDRIRSDSPDNELVLEGLGQLLTHSQWEGPSTATTTTAAEHVKIDFIWPMVHDLAKTGQATIGDSGSIQTSKRIQFLLQDLMDLKQNRWELKARLVQAQARTLDEIHEQMEMEEESDGIATTKNSALSFMHWRSANTAPAQQRSNRYSDPADCAEHMHSMIRVYLLNEEEPVEHVMEKWNASVGEGPLDDEDYQARVVAVLADSILMALEMKSQQVERLQTLVQRIVCDTDDKTTMTSLLLRGLQLPLELLRDVELDAPKAVFYLGQFLTGFDISIRDLFFQGTPDTWPERPGALAVHLVATQVHSREDDLKCMEEILQQSGEAREHSTIVEWITQVKDSNKPKN